MSKHSEGLTQWFSAEVKPALTGLYQRMYDTEQETSQPDYWDGKVWRYDEEHGVIAISQTRPWRGLAEEPIAGANAAGGQGAAA